MAHLKIPLGSKYLIIRYGDYFDRRRGIRPFFKRGPFRTFTLYLKWFELEFGLKRWI